MFEVSAAIHVNGEVNVQIAISLQRKAKT